MLDLITDLWRGVADAALLILGAALDVAVALHAAFAAMPLPVGLIAIAAGLAVGQALAERAGRNH